MKFLKNLFKRQTLKKYEVDKTYYFDDFTTHESIPNDYIPDSVMDDNLLMYNCGYNEGSNSYTIIIRSSLKDIT